MMVPSIQARGVIAAGFSGAAFDPGLPRFGAYALFARNLTTLQQTRELTDALRAHGDDGVAPAIAIDQEGGRVVRLRDGVEPMPSMMALGATGDPDLARRAGEQAGFDLRRAGCTLDFAPVLDLALHPDNMAIGTRSLGSDPQRVAALGRAWCQGLRAAGIAGCAKHVPGHGATAIDSHVGLPSIESDAATLLARDLVPFLAVSELVPAMMVAHAIVPAIDPHVPATLSHEVVATVRRELDFGGVLVTDCLQMGALQAFGSLEERAVGALDAGADLLVISHDPEGALSAAAAIDAAVDDGRLPARRLNEAHERVLALRARTPDPLPLLADPPHPGVGREIARRAVTLVRGSARVDPSIAVAVSFEGQLREGINPGAGARSSLVDDAPGLHEIVVPLDPATGRVEALTRELRELRRRPLLLLRRARAHPHQLQAARAIVSGFPDAIAIALLEPYDVSALPQAATALAVYGDDACAMAGLAEVLFGRVAPAGRLPVELS